MLYKQSHYVSLLVGAQPALVGYCVWYTGGMEGWGARGEAPSTTSVTNRHSVAVSVSLYVFCVAEFVIHVV